MSKVLFPELGVTAVNTISKASCPPGSSHSWLLPALKSKLQGNTDTVGLVPLNLQGPEQGLGTECAFNTYLLNRQSAPPI